MSDLSIEDEIREIREHLDRLQREQDTKISPSINQETEAEQYSSSAETSQEFPNTKEFPFTTESLASEFHNSELLANVSSHAKEWLSALNEDLKETKPTTLLAIFSLGVIVGRLSSK